MNRKMRRAIARAKPPKPARHVTKGNMLVAGYRVLRPIEAIIERLDIDGTIDTIQGMAVYYDGEDTYEVVPALNGLTDWIELSAAKIGASISTEPLHELRKCLEFDMPVTEKKLNAVKSLLPKLRAFLSRLPVDVALSNLTTVQIGSYLNDESETANNATA